MATSFPGTWMKIRKLLYRIGASLVLLFFLVFLLVSPITKYVIEANSEDWTGRKVKMDKLWINLISGSIHIGNFQMFEAGSEEVFLSFEDFDCNISVLRLFINRYKIESLTLDKPYLNIIQDGERFNFDDLIKRFSDTTATAPDAVKDTTKYFLEDMKIVSGVVGYATTTPQTSISVVDLNVGFQPVTYRDTRYGLDCDFGFGTGGRIATNFYLDTKAMNYNMKLMIHSLNLNFLIPYLKEFLKFKSFDGLVDGDLFVAGSLEKSEEVALSGLVTVNDFSLIDETGEKLAAFSKYEMEIDSMNTPEGIYDVHFARLYDPHVQFAMYDDGYNFDRILVDQGDDSLQAPVEEYANIFQMIAGYIRDIYMQYDVEDYEVDELAMENGHVIFTDYTLEERFRYELDSLDLNATNMNSQNERIVLELSGLLNGAGRMDGTLSVNPQGYEDMDIEYSISDIMISDINPYSKFYVATPFLDGLIFITNSTSIENKYIISENRLLIEEIEVGDKISNKPLYELPVKLAVAILKDPKGNIDFDIPVEGDLSDPNYKIGHVVWQIFKNLIIKAASSPYKALAGSFGGNESDYQEIRFQYLQDGIDEEQKRILNQLVTVLRHKPELGIEFLQCSYEADEVEQLAVYLSKKEYLGWKGKDSLSTNQKNTLLDLSVKDSLFVNWINKKVNDESTLVPIQDKCISYIGEGVLTEQVKSLRAQRNERLASHLIAQGVQERNLKVRYLAEAEIPPGPGIPKYLLGFFVDDGIPPTEEVRDVGTEQ